MYADALATQGAKASATMILTKLNPYNSVPARQGLTLFEMPCYLIWINKA